MGCRIFPIPRPFETVERIEAIEATEPLELAEMMRFIG
jgi:hypothetical protein